MMTLDKLGTITRPATFDEKGAELTPAETLKGYHVNIARQDMTPELEPFVVKPGRMACVFAGDDPDDPQFTVALRFEDEAEANSVLDIQEAPE